MGTSGDELLHQATSAFVIFLLYWGGFPCGSTGKESAYNVGDLGSTLGWENPLEKGKATHSWRTPWTV